MTNQVPPSLAWSAGELLQFIRQGRAESRARLAQLTGLASTTVAGRIDQLVSAGYLTQGDNDRGGRSPRSLAIDPAAAFFLVADIGARHVRTAIADAAGDILVTRQDDFDSTQTLDAFVAWLAGTFDDMIAGYPALPGQRLRGIGLSVPAPVHAQTGRVVYPARIPTWHDADLATPLSERFGVPVDIGNDATLMALGEHRRHQSGTQDMLFVKIGSGIGCGIIAGGEVHRGATGGAGDIGHVSVDVPFARRCLCGRDDCLEASVGGASLVRLLRERGVPVETTADIAELASQSQPDTVELARTAGRAIGEAVAIIANFFNPELIVVGGGLSPVEPLYNALVSALYERSLALTTRELRIEVSRNGRDAGIYGPVCMELDRFFSAQSVNLVVASAERA